ncbi:MAG: DUF3604 domain-containing protein [Planctomycetes bacterium]|nr:DUF3604 domain-containing protein [Planctomycetota bacterium]
MLVISRVAPGKPELHHCSDMPDEERLRLHGRASHTPIDKLTVSQPTAVAFEFVIGEYAVVTGGRLMVVWRWPFDWSDLQTVNPAGDGYMRTDVVAAHGRDHGDVTLDTNYKWIAGIEPWHHVITVKVTAGELRTGDTVRIVCGETIGGGRGWCAPTCAARRARFLMLIDHQGNGKRIRLVDSPPFRICADQAVRLVAFAPSDATVDAPFEVTVRTEDRWGNPTKPPTPTQLSDPGSGVAVERVPTHDADPPFEKFRVTASHACELSFHASNGELTASTNRVHVHAKMPPWQLFWGDVHSGQTEIGCGAGSLAEHYAFGRDCAGLQFTTHQANDHYVTLDEWNHTRQVTDDFYETGRYVPFLGCEWSALTKDGGDRNVFYLEDEPRLRRSDRFFVESEPDPEPDVRTGPEFVDVFSELNVLVNIHVGGRMTNLQWHAPKIEKLCEIHSTHGTSEWFVHDVLNRGYRVGITAGTDGVMGRPGACHPGRRLIRNLRNGLTAVYAKELTRESLWEAFQQHRCYATTGERIRLWFEVNGAAMGSEIQSEGDPEIAFQIEGTSAIERVELLRGTEVVHTWQVARYNSTERDSADDGVLLRLLWGGTERKGTARLQRVKWDGTLSVSNGELELLDTVNVQSFADRVESTGPASIRWSNATAGNTTGIIVRVRGAEGTRLHFQSQPVTWDVDLSEVRENEQVFEAGGISRFVKVGPAPRTDGPQQFHAGWVDAKRPAGVVPYWIRVVQVDQAMAWSSPVYVHRCDIDPPER